MASISARLAVIGENGFSESDQDANSALMELDKGLRSSKLGEQCEAIVRFSKLFEKYPFPILINSACLKLSEVFRIGTNFLRVLVLRVMQQNEKHLDKILNIDEFLRRIYSVIYSNDPVARALTLRTLGSIAGIAAERKNIHHSIQSSLDSHDQVEIKAAIYAAGKFASKSNVFASNICNKIAAMIGLATPVGMKLRLLSVFQQMHHDAETTTLVRELCLSLLSNYPSGKFIHVTLNVLTHLASASVTSIPVQIELLLQYLHDDQRLDIQSLVLKNLNHLAVHGPHLFTADNIEAIVNYALNVPYLNLRVHAVTLLASLANSVAVDKFGLADDCAVLQLCQECAYHENIVLASATISLLSQLAIHSLRENIDLEFNPMDEVVTTIETLLLLICSQNERRSDYEEGLRTVFKSVVNLCKVNSDLCSQFVDSLGSLLSSYSGPYTWLLCEVLCALGNRSAGILSSLRPELLNMISKFSIAQMVSDQSNSCSKEIIMVYTLYFQAGINNVNTSLPEMPFLSSSLEDLDLWTVFRIARQATRYGHHTFATPVFFQLSNQVSSEHFHFWLTGLYEICKAECCFSEFKELETILNRAIVHYIKAVAAFKAATNPQHSSQFQQEYTRLRCEMLQCFSQLLHSSSCLNTSPPPAIAVTLALTTRDDLLKCGRVVTQLRKTAKDFRSLAEQYGSLYQSVFDAHPKTLSHLQLLQQSCLLVVQAVEQVAQYNQGVTLSTAVEDDEILAVERMQHTLENYRMIEACKQVSKLIRDFDEGTEVKVIGKNKTDHLRKLCQIILQVPLCLPRYFFQCQQSTTIKLAISPQPKLSGDPIMIAHTANLAIKVEGVVQHGQRPGLFRKVSKVLLSVSSVLQLKSTSATSGLELKIQNDNCNLMTQVVDLHNDYFQSQFLLAFPTVGLHAVTVESSVIDETDSQWTTGPKMILNVKSHEEMTGGQKASGQSTSSRSGFQTRF